MLRHAPKMATWEPNLVGPWSSSAVGQQLRQVRLSYAASTLLRLGVGGREGDDDDDPAQEEGGDEGGAGSGGEGGGPSGVPDEGGAGGSGGESGGPGSDAGVQGGPAGGSSEDAAMSTGATSGDEDDAPTLPRAEEVQKFVNEVRPVESRSLES